MTTTVAADTGLGAPPVGVLDRFLAATRAGPMASRLAAVVGGGPEPCHVLDAQLEPGVRAIVVYRLGSRLLRGDLIPEPEDGASGPVAVPGVLVSTFPSDRGLPTLPRVLDRDVLGEVLAVVAGAVARGCSRRDPRARSLLLRYRPGKRATVLTARVGDRSRYVAKVYHDDRKAAAVASEAHRLTVAAAPARTLALAPTLAHLPDLHLVVQRAVPGTPLEALLGARSGGAAVAGAARALAELHGLGQVTDRERSVLQELRRFRARAAGIAVIDPRAGEGLGALAERLQVLYGGLPAARPGPVHGDCKPGQFLHAGQRTYLMDLDHLGLSDPAADVGTFLASLRQIQVRRSLRRPSHRTGAPVALLAQVFLAAYREARGGGLDAGSVNWHEAAALERKALRAFARAPASPLPLALAAAAHRRLDAVEREEACG